MHVVVSILYMVWVCYLPMEWEYMLWDGLVWYRVWGSICCSVFV